MLGNLLESVHPSLSYPILEMLDLYWRCCIFPRGYMDAWTRVCPDHKVALAAKVAPRAAEAFALPAAPPSLHLYLSQHCQPHPLADVTLNERQIHSVVSKPGRAREGLICLLMGDKGHVLAIAVTQEIESR